MKTKKKHIFYVCLANVYDEKKKKMDKETKSIFYYGWTI